LGGEWRANTAVDSVDAEVIECGGELFEFDLAIDARGFGAKPQRHDLRGVRGEVLWVHAPEVNLSRPVRLMHPRYQLYIAPKRNHVYVIGATQIESESLAPITVRSCLELQSALYSIHTGFAEAAVIDAFASCRPAFLDNLPRIDKRPGFLSVNGLYRHGYLLSPLVLDLALQCVDGDVQHAIVRELRLVELVDQE
jgi:glycine oxidase